MPEFGLASKRAKVTVGSWDDATDWDQAYLRNFDKPAQPPSLDSSFR
jgi:hypothetical protein